MSDASLVAANQLLLKKLLIVAVGMFAFGFALVPFYDTICRVTGIRNVFQPDEVSVKNTQVDLARTVSIEFDANVQRLPWTFKPLSAHVTVHPGEVTQVMYEIRNTLDRPVTGQAVPSYGPAYAGQYFRKIECFCFQQQTLAAGEVKQMPVVFVVDSGLPAEVNTITLSYTFFEVAGTRGKPG